MADIFISYKREDRSRAREIADGIQRHGFSVFFDAEIDVGESFDERIEREISEAKCVVVLWSERSTNARWVKREARFGATHERLAPAVIGDCKIPLEFSDVQAANLQAWRGDPGDAEWRQFIERITECTHKPAIALSPAPWRRRWVRVVAGAAVAAALIGGGYAAWRVYGPVAIDAPSAPGAAPSTGVTNVAARVPSPEAQDFLAGEVRGYFPETGAQMTPEMCGFAGDWVTTTRARYPDWQYVQDVAERLRRRCPSTGSAPTPPPAATQTPGQTSGPAGPSTPSAPAQDAPPAARPNADVAFLARLVARDLNRPSTDDIAASARRLGVRPAAVAAFLDVEAASNGFGAEGRPLILFEPHIFSRLTQRRFDASNPNVSYPTWDRTRYPRNQEGRWAQLREAYQLDPDAALSAASWGLFQVLGTNYARAGFDSPQAFVQFLSQSQTNQLIAAERFIESGGLADEMQRLDWEGFARGYNGPGQVDRYGGMLRAAYERYNATP